MVIYFKSRINSASKLIIKIYIYVWFYSKCFHLFLIYNFLLIFCSYWSIFSEACSSWNILYFLRRCSGICVWVFNFLSVNIVSLLFLFCCRVYSSRNLNTNHLVGGIILFTGNNYYDSLDPPLNTEKILCPGSKEVPNMSSHREQDSNKSRQTRCAASAGSRGRRTSTRSSRSNRNIKVEPPPLLVQNLLETL